MLQEEAMERKRWRSSPACTCLQATAMALCIAASLVTWCSGSGNTANIWRMDLRNNTPSLGWFEQHATMESAIRREKQIKKWNRAWKLRLIDELNPSWRDLWPDITGQEARSNVHGSPPARG